MFHYSRLSLANVIRIKQGEMHAMVRGNVFNRGKLSSHISVKNSMYVKFHAVDIFACKSQ